MRVEVQVRRSFITTTVREESHWATRAPPVGFELESVDIRGTVPVTHDSMMCTGMKAGNWLRLRTRGNGLERLDSFRVIAPGTGLKCRPGASDDWRD